jgi:hypothetical protein
MAFTCIAIDRPRAKAALVAPFEARAVTPFLLIDSSLAPTLNHTPVGGRAGAFFLAVFFLPHRASECWRAKFHADQFIPSAKLVRMVHLLVGPAASAERVERACLRSDTRNTHHPRRELGS